MGEIGQVLVRFLQLMKITTTAWSDGTALLTGHLVARYVRYVCFTPLTHFAALHFALLRSTSLLSIHGLAHSLWSLSCVTVENLESVHAVNAFGGNNRVCCRHLKNTQCGNEGAIIKGQEGVDFFLHCGFVSIGWDWGQMKQNSNGCDHRRVSLKWTRYPG